MKITTKFILLLLFFWSHIALTQSPQLTQQQTATSFANNFLKGQFDSCWVLLDKTINPNMNVVKFKELLTDARLNLPKENDNIELVMTGHRFFNDNKMAFYTFKFAEEENNTTWHIFDVLFISDDSNLVVGFRPNKMTSIKNDAFSFEGPSTIISNKEEVKKYTVLGANMVVLDNKYNLISIQVDKAVPSSRKESDRKFWAKKEGLKLAHWFYKSEHFQQVTNKAKEEKMTLISEIGVSFIDPKTTVPYNVLIKAIDYKKK